MRYFLAQKAHIYDYRGLVESASPCLKGHWRTEHSLHATVLFLGEDFTEEEILQRVAACDYELKHGTVTGLGRFQHNRIFYAGADHPGLIEAHRRLSGAFDMRPSRHYVGHVTLMRYKNIDTACFDAAHAQFDGALLGKISGPLILMKSITTPDGAVYEEIHHF